MVKPELDVSIDYYSLLNVTTRADNEEIKKQYRKLGTSYLPFPFPFVLSLSISLSNLTSSVTIPP